MHMMRPSNTLTEKYSISNNNNNKLAPYETDGRLFATDVSAKFKVT